MRNAAFVQQQDPRQYNFLVEDAVAAGKRRHENDKGSRITLTDCELEKPRAKAQKQPQAEPPKTPPSPKSQQEVR